MKTIDINGRDGGDFNAIFINVLRQFWKNTRSFQCIGDPKKQNLLLYLNGCKATYTDKSGEVFVAESGDLVYTPVGSEYSARLSDFSSAESHTIGINFLLTDKDGESVALADGIRIFHIGHTGELCSLVYRAEIGEAGRTPLETRILLFEILCALTANKEEQRSTVVARCIKYLSEHVIENPSVSELAERCGVSEVYLRRKFKEQMGVSPAKFRNELRLEKAASYLKFGDITVQEISDTLGYATVSHFIKEFKGRYGISPLQYRKTREENGY